MFSALVRSHPVRPEVLIHVRSIGSALAAVLGVTVCAHAAPAAQPTAAPRPRPGPQILGASVSPAVVRSGTVVRATVRTTAGVVSVVAHAGGVGLAVPRVGPGLFAGSTTIPPLPPFVHGSYPVTFVARDARGASTQSAVGVTVR